ncbi:exosome complex exonuclease Rrp41 [Candidatus Micrarchaeota archaeon]|nr:exosome complex exonuclease Rrp41 [Candidatus Micrarchaeota archaeon]
MDKPELFKDGKRIDGRTPKELRPLKIEAGVLEEASGSAYVEWGGNKVVAGVYGPRECIPKHGADPYKALLKVRYTMAPFCSKSEHGRSGPNRRSREISKVLREAFEPVVMLNQFPKTQIDVYVEVLQAEGGTRVSALTAAAVALADAGIPMKEMVSGVAVGKLDGQLVVDLGKDEDNYGESDVPMAITSKGKELVLLQMDGLLTREELARNLDEGIEACEKVYELQAQALRKSYESAHERGKLRL